jgi:hypothetical protein
MTSTQHGLAALSEDLFLGSRAVQVTVHGESMLMSDREFRDVLACARDLFPSMFQWPLPEPVKPHPSPEAARAERCNYCPALAQIFDETGRWCSDEHRRFDRGNEETWWRKAAGR